MKELVSVVIPTYNRAKTIHRAIESVLNQTYKEIEVIVVDDCSKDNTADVVKKEFGRDLRVIFHKLEKNLGACVARNRGVQLSKGKYVAFLDSDDAFLPEKISKQIACIEKSNVSLCATDYTLINENGRVLVKTHPGTKEEVYSKLLYCNFITTGTLMGYRECFIEEPFDESLPRYQDWDLVLRLSKKYSFYFLQESTLLQYSQQISITTSTNHEKTLRALNTIYNKNLDGYKFDKKAYSQVHWLIGVHGLFVEGVHPYKHMMIGATHWRINFRRLGLILMSLFDKLVIDKKI